MGYRYEDEPDYGTGRDILFRLLEAPFKKGEVSKEEYDLARSIIDSALVIEQWKGDE